MRLASLALALLLASPALAQWSLQSPTPTWLDVRGVAAPAPGHVFLATDDDPFDDGGALWESLDGGTTWSQRDLPGTLGTLLNGLFFYDGQLGWAFGNRQYRTTDGGTTWDLVGLPGTVYDMTFYTPAFGSAVVGGNQPPLVSRDSATTWMPSPDTLVTYAFADAQLGLGATAQRVADNGIYRTTDAGETFALVRPGAASAVAFLSPAVALGIVDDAFVRSTDAGVTWTPGAPALGRTRFEVVTEQVVLAWRRSPSGADGQLLRSADGGQTWTDLGPVFPEGTAALTVVTPEVVVGLDRNGDLYRSADAGATWTRVYASPGPQPSFFSSVRPVFESPTTGYVAYDRGFVVKTTDGGATWTQVSSGYGASLFDVARLDDGSLMAVGERGTVLVQAAGATTWQLRPRPTNRDLVALDVIGPNAVGAVAPDGRVYIGTADGRAWTAAPATPPDLQATALVFTSPLDGWLTGLGFGASALWRTTDGGATWAPATETRGSFVALDFEGTNGWVAGASGRLLRTDDGGTTWVVEMLPDDPNALDVRDLDFATPTVGYAVGARGYAVRSADGGRTWTRLPTPNRTDFFTDLHLLGPDELWISTSQGMAYYSATGGQTWARLDTGSDGFGGFEALVGTADGDATMVGGFGEIWHFDGPPPPPDNRPPEASYDFASTGLTVTLTDTSSDPDGTVVGWAWDFGDSRPDSTSTLQNPTHTFDEAGTYHVRLTVTDDDGATDTALRFIAVQPGPGGTFGDFTEVTPLDSLWVTPQDRDFVVVATAAADVDGDLDLDLAVLGYYVVYNVGVEHQLLLLVNDAPSTPDQWAYTPVRVPLGGMTAGASDLAWGDADGDGDEDLLVGSDGQTTLYRNDAGTLVPTDTVLPGYAEDNDQADFDLQSITWADVDNDGDLDLLMPSVRDAATFQYRTALLRNDGPTGTGGVAFTEVPSPFAPTRHAQSDWADYDGDGDLDLLLVHLAPLTPDGFIRRYRNDGGRTFVGEDVLGGLTVEHGEAQWGDVDADGDLDLLVAGNVGETNGTFTLRAFRVYRNDDDTFTRTDVLPCIACEGWFDLSAATWADYDSDGDVDLLVAGTHNPGTGQIEGRAMVFLNNGQGTFSPVGDALPAPRSSGYAGGAFTWLDVDADGDLDYFIAGTYFVPGGNGRVEAQMHLYRHDGTRSNAAPSAPSGLLAMAGAAPGEVTFAWTPATDDTTPASALTYDLDLRRDGVPVVTPRHRPAPGPIRDGTGWALAGLADGTYTWTVRAVDSAYNGGPRATGTVTVGTVAAGEGPTLPTTYALGTPHPNPSRTSAALRLDLPHATGVTVEVYDLLGRRVARLLDGFQPAGTHDLVWAHRGAAEGVYMVRAQSAAWSAVQRLTVVR